MFYYCQSFTFFASTMSNAYMFSNLDFKATFGLAIKVTLDSNMVGNLSLKVKKTFWL